MIFPPISIGNYWSNLINENILKDNFNFQNKIGYAKTCLGSFRTPDILFFGVL